MSDFNPYAAPEAEIRTGPHVSDDSGVWRDGNVLVMTKDADLGDRCVKCGAASGGRTLKRKLSWHRPAWYVIILFNVIVYILVAMAVRHTATVFLPLCDRHRSQRRRAIAVAWLLALLGPVMMIAAGASEVSLRSAVGPENASRVMAVLVIAGFVTIVTGLVYGIIGSQPVVASRIDKRFVWLKKVGPEVLATLPDWSEA